METNKQNGELGAMIGIIIVVIVLIVGGLYFGKQRIEKSKEFQNTLSEGQVLSNSDELTDIENDAAGMNFDALGSDINNL